MDLLRSAAGKIVSTVVGVVLFIVLMTAKGWLTRDRSVPSAGGPPIPPGKLSLVVDAVPVDVRDVAAFLCHPDEGAVCVEWEGQGFACDGDLDLDGDGKTNGRDDFPGDIDDVSSCRILIGRTFRIRGGRDEILTLPGRPAADIVEIAFTPREYWRPEGYNGTDAWRGEIEIRVKGANGEETLRGTFEGPVTHTW